MTDSTFADPDVTTFARLDGLGLRVVGQFLEPDRAILECSVVNADQRCRRCGGWGRPRDTTTRRLAHEPLGWRPTVAVGHGPPVPLRRVRSCVATGHQQGGAATGQALPWSTAVGVGGHRVSAPDGRQSRRGTWCLVEHGEQLVLAEGRRVLIADPGRFDGVRSSGSTSTCGAIPAAATSTSR